MLDFNYPTYQNPCTLVMVVDGGQVKGRPPVLAALLNIETLSKLAHPGEGIYAIQLRGQVDRGLLLVVQDARVHLPATQYVNKSGGGKLWSVITKT